MEISNTRKESFSRGNIRKDPATVLELTPIPMGLISLGNIQKTNGMVPGRCTIHKESVFPEHYWIIFSTEYGNIHLIMTLNSIEHSFKASKPKKQN